MSSNNTAITIVEEDIKRLQYFRQLIAARYQTKRNLRYRCELIHLQKELTSTKNERFNLLKMENEREINMFFNQNYITEASNECGQLFQQFEEERNTYYSSKFDNGSSSGSNNLQSSTETVPSRNH